MKNVDSWVSWWDLENGDKVWCLSSWGLYLGQPLEQPGDRGQILQLRISKTESAGRGWLRRWSACCASLGTQVQIPSTHVKVEGGELWLQSYQRQANTRTQCLNPAKIENSRFSERKNRVVGNRGKYQKSALGFPVHRCRQAHPHTRA